jgi:hypothetical protein
VASIASIDMRRAEVHKREQAAAEWLATELGVEVPAIAERVAQPELQQVLERERLVAILEGVREMFEAKSGGGGVDPSALAGTVADVKEYLVGIDDPKALAMLHAAETEGKTRKGVLSAIEARQAEVEAAEDEDEDEE